MYINFYLFLASYFFVWKLFIDPSHIVETHSSPVLLNSKHYFKSSTN